MQRHIVQQCRQLAGPPFPAANIVEGSLAGLQRDIKIIQRGQRLKLPLRRPPTPPHQP